MIRAVACACADIESLCDELVEIRESGDFRESRLDMVGADDNRAVVEHLTGRAIENLLVFVRNIVIIVATQVPLQRLTGRRRR